MWYKTKDRAVIRFEREIQPRPEIWTWLWVILAFYTMLLFNYRFLPFAGGNIIEDPNFLRFVVVPGCCLLIVQLITRRLTSGSYLRSLELVAGNTLRWSTGHRKREFPLHDISLLKLYTTKHSPAWEPNPKARHSGSVYHRNGVIFIDKLSVSEFQQLEGFFGAIIYANPEVELVNDITPYDASIDTTEAGA